MHVVELECMGCGLGARLGRSKTESGMDSGLGHHDRVEAATYFMNLALTGTKNVSVVSN